MSRPRWTASARYVNDNLADYLVPVNADVDQVEIIMVPEEDHEVNPAGVKGIGELGNVGDRRGGRQRGLSRDRHPRARVADPDREAAGLSRGGYRGFDTCICPATRRTLRGAARKIAIAEITVAARPIQNAAT